MPLYYKSGSSWVEFSSNPYPIGTLVSNVNNVSPATLVGGTWEKAMSGDITSQIKIVYDGINSLNALVDSTSKVTGNFNFEYNSPYYSNGEILASGFPPASGRVRAGYISGTVSYNNSSIHISDSLYVETNGNLTVQTTGSLTGEKLLSVSCSISYQAMPFVFEWGGHTSTNVLPSFSVKGGGVNG